MADAFSERVQSGRLQGAVGTDYARDPAQGTVPGPFLNIYLWPCPPLCPENRRGLTLHTKIGCTLFACAKAGGGGCLLM